PTPSKPRLERAPSIAFPCGSRTPFFNVTVTRALITSVPIALLHQYWSGSPDRLVLVDDAQPAGNLRIGFDQATKVTTESVLVHLLLGLDIPQAAAVGGNLVGEDDPHHVAFIEAAALNLEVHQLDADAEEQAGQEVV